MRKPTRASLTLIRLVTTRETLKLFYQNRESVTTVTKRKAVTRQGAGNGNFKGIGMEVLLASRFGILSMAPTDLT